MTLCNTLPVIHNQSDSCVLFSCPRPLGSPVQEKKECDRDTVQKRFREATQSVTEQQQIFCLHPDIHVQSRAVLL